MPKNSAAKIGVILYTVRDHAGTPAEAARTLKRLRAIGYRNIQVSGRPFLEIPAAELKTMADDAGVAIVGAHIGVDVMRQDLDALIDKLRLWNASYVAIPSYRPEGQDLAAGWRAFGKECNRIGRALARAGIRLQYHNHAFEFERLGVRRGVGGRTPHSILFAQSDPAFLQAEIDLGWVARAGIDPAQHMQGFKGRSDQVHVKDWGIINNEPAWRAIGQGNLNWPAILKACRAAKVAMYIVEQDSCPATNDPFRSLEISFEYLAAQSL